MNQQSSTPKTRPAGIILDRRAHQLRISWEDGHASSYPLDALREACPCAVCRGGHENMGAEHAPDLIELKPARSYEVKNIQLVGNYAIQFQWDDGHDSGIYTWGYLRHICPCPKCQAERKG
jgi:DUF971 family protein